MSSRTRGQSLVEMAFILPILLILMFGITEFGYFIYAYSTVSQAARNAAEAAAQLPPYETWLGYKSSPPANFPGFLADKCVNTIVSAAASDSTLFGGDVNSSRRMSDFITISYPNGGETRNLKDRGPIEVTINYPVRGITPLYDLIGIEGGALNLIITQRRSIENLGSDPSSPTGAACAKDLDDWRDLQDTP